MIEVRKATSDELPLVFQIMLESFEEYRGVLEPPSAALTESLDDVRRLVARGGALLAFLDGEVAGSGRYELMDDYVYCSRLAVLPSKRRHGIGAAMLDFVDQVAREARVDQVRLSTREVMESNLELYARQGYDIVAKYPHPRGGGMVVDLAKKLR